MGDQTTQRELLAKEYDAVHNRLYVVQLVVVAALLALFQLSGASATLADGLTARFGVDLWYVTNAMYILIVIFGFSACMFPFSYYSDHVLEHHYELSDETFGEWSFDFTKALFVDLLIGVIVFSVIYVLLRLVPEWWWLCATVFYILFSVVLSTLVPLIISPLFHKFEPLRDDELAGAVQAMMDEADIKILGVFKWGFEEKTSTASAALSGFGKNKRIVLSESLLRCYSNDEILAILAHEVGHCKNRDTLRLVVISSVLALIGFYISNLCLVGLIGLLGFEHIFDIGAAPLFIFSLFIFSVISMPISHLQSRRCEFAADAAAIKKMGTAEPLISALEKMADQNLSNKEPALWIELLLHSQPSTARRIARMQQK